MAPMGGATVVEGTAWRPPGEPDICNLHKSRHFSIAPTQQRALLTEHLRRDYRAIGIRLAYRELRR